MAEVEVVVEAGVELEGEVEVARKSKLLPASEPRILSNARLTASERIYGLTLTNLDQIP